MDFELSEEAQRKLDGLPSDGKFCSDEEFERLLAETFNVYSSPDFESWANARLEELHKLLPRFNVMQFDPVTRAIIHLAYQNNPFLGMSALQINGLIGIGYAIAKEGKY